MMGIVLLAVFLGLVQAITEFLPVSSSAHLILAREALDFNVVDGLTFDVSLHIGTLIATVVYFWGDLRALARGFVASLARGGRTDDPAGRLAWYVLAACIPAAIVGFLFEDAIEIYFRHPGVIVVTLILGAFLFLWVEKRFTHAGDMSTLTARRAVTIGLAQTLALIPGVSRSGITIVTGMMCGLTREQAARFSFLMAAPITFGAALKKSIDLFSSPEPISADERTALIAGILASGIGGWLVIKFLLSFLRRHGLHVFAYYRIALAIVVLAVLVL
jgi:undecaprenyl-diphosphatase